MGFLFWHLPGSTSVRAELFKSTVSLIPFLAPFIGWILNTKQISRSKNERTFLKNATRSHCRIDILLSSFSVVTDLVKTDSGEYTCVASSRSGKATWSAHLRLESPTNPNIAFYRAPEASTFPGHPTRPVLVNRTHNSVTISWSRNNKIGSSSLIGYQVIRIIIWVSSNSVRFHSTSASNIFAEREVQWVEIFSDWDVHSLPTPGGLWASIIAWVVNCCEESSRSCLYYHQSPSRGHLCVPGQGWELPWHVPSIAKVRASIPSSTSGPDRWWRGSRHEGSESSSS